ncbi:hypothetical protein ACFQX7_33885 [Luedemannella flava]
MLFRPPYGSPSATLKAVEQEYGLTEVLRDVDTRDWSGVTTDAIVQTAATATAGQVILMHDGYQTTINAVPQMVAGLTSRGLCAGMISPTTTSAVVTSRAPSPPAPARPAPDRRRAGRSPHCAARAGRRPPSKGPTRPGGAVSCPPYGDEFLIG